MKPTERRTREIVDRELEASEIATYESLDAIPPVVESLALRIAHHNMILACKYLHERVPGGRLSDAKVALEAIMERS